MTDTASGYFKNGLPYNKLGSGSETMIIFQGLLFENKPLKGSMAKSFIKAYSFLAKDYTVYIVTRKPDLPEGYTIQNMADDYAQMIKEEFKTPMDILGVSTGGSIAQQFAADNPDLVKKLIIHSSAYSLNEKAKKLQLEVGELARQYKWKKAFGHLISFMILPDNFLKYFVKPVVWFISQLIALMGFPEDPSDLIITINAEDKFNFKDHLKNIKSPSLVIAGDKDPFYSKKLFHDTAENIPNSKLIIYKGMGHPASGKQFIKDVLSFLN